MRIHSLALLSTLLFAGCGRHVTSNSPDAVSAVKDINIAYDEGQGLSAGVPAWVKVMNAVDDGDGNISRGEAKRIVEELGGTSRPIPGAHLVILGLKSCPESNPNSKAIRDSGANLERELYPDEAL